MSKKLVKYNGEKKSYYASSDPKVLTKGQVYEVVCEKVSGFHTEYVLKGIKGEFNSIWFDEVSTNVYTAIGNHIPVVGERYECYKIVMNNGAPSCIGWLTSSVKSFSNLGNNIYDIYTQNSRYIVTVG